MEEEEIFVYSGKQTFQYEDTFTQTIILNLALVIAMLLIFGTVKFIFPSYYMPILQSNTKNWLKDIFSTPLNKYAQKGNVPLFFVIFQSLLLRLFVHIILLSAVIVSPVYFFGGNQSKSVRSFWSRLQINQLEDGSVLTCVPIVAAVILAFTLMQFYREFHIIHLYYKQLVLKRASPQNFVIMLDCLPKELQFHQNLLDALQQCFPLGQVRKILPIPINTFLLFHKSFHLKRLIRNVHRFSRHVFAQKARITYLQILQMQKPGQINKFLLQKAFEKLKKYKKCFYKAQMGSKKHKNAIFKIMDVEQIDVSYLKQVDQLFPPFPACVKSFKFLDKEEPDLVNTVYLEKLQKRLIHREAHFSNMQQKLVKENKPIGSACFIIFKTQKEASLAAQACLFSDNTEPTVLQAPHPQEIIWHNAGAQKKQQLSFAILFWVSVVVVFLLYFVPQAYLLGFINKNSFQWFKSIYRDVCIYNLGCPENVQMTGEARENLGSLGCYICYTSSSMLVTTIGTLISALFLSLLPQILNLLLFIPKFKTVTQRRNTKFICLFVFLFLIQGILTIFFGAAYDTTGVLQVTQFFDISLSQLIQRIGTNISSQSFVFLNYVITKYFFFSVLNILHLQDLISTIFNYFIRKDLVLKAQTFRYKNFDYVTYLVYVCHMMVVGSMYSLVSPVTMIVIFIALATMTFVSRYNILYVYQQMPISDMSGKNDIFKKTINVIYIGFIMCPLTLFSYITVAQQHLRFLYLTILTIVIACLIIAKYLIDQKFHISLNQLKLGNYESDNMNQNPFLNRLRFNAVSYIQKISCLNEYYLTGQANEESLENYQLTEKDIDFIATHYTHPGIALAMLYPGEQDDWFVI